MKKDEIEVLDLEEVKEDENVEEKNTVDKASFQDDIEELLEVEKKEEKKELKDENIEKKIKDHIVKPINKVLIILFLIVAVLILIFLIFIPLFSRWNDRAKRKKDIYNSKYKVLVCSKTTKRTNNYSEIDAVKVYYSRKKAKKIDYILEDDFYDKSDEYTKMLDECSKLDNKKEDVLGYSKACLINDKKITINKEYDLELFDNDSKANEKIKSVVKYDQNISEVEEYFISKNYKCE